MTITFDDPPPTQPGARVLQILLTLPAYRHWRDAGLPDEIVDWLDRRATPQELLSLGAATLERILRLE